jgi:hypothetical protein
MKERLLVLLMLCMVTFSYSVLSAQESIALTIRCKANVNGGEGWRCDNFTQVEEQVEQALSVQLDLTLIRPIA